MRKALRNAAPAAIGGFVLLAALAGAADTSNGSAGQQRLIKSPDNRPWLRYEPVVHPSGEVLYAKKSRAGLGLGRAVLPTMKTPTRASGSTSPGAVGTNVRASKGVVVAGRFNNPRGCFDSVSVQGSKGAMMTADGNYVVFQSIANNLITGDTNGQSDIFRLRLSDGVVELVDVTSAGAQARAPYEGDFNSSHNPAASSDGRYIAFFTDKALVAGDTDITTDCYLRDMNSTTGAVKLLSGTASAGDATAALSNPDRNAGTDYSYFVNVWSLDISADGNKICFGFPDISFFNSINLGQVYHNGFMWVNSTNTRNMWTHDPGDGTLSADDTVFDFRLSGNGGVAIASGFAPLGVGVASSRNLIGCNFDAAGTATDVYVINAPNGINAAVGNTSRTGVSPGPCSLSDSGTFVGFVTNAGTAEGNPTAGRSMYLKHTTGGFAQADMTAVAFQASNPAGDFTAEVPTTPFPRLGRQAWVNHNGNKMYISTSADLVGGSWTDDVPNFTGFAEGTSYERYAVFSYSWGSADGSGGTLALASNSAGGTLPLSYDYLPASDSAETKLFFKNADLGVSVDGQSAQNQDMIIRTGTTRTRLLTTPIVAGQTNDHSEAATISADGNWIAYTTWATNIEAGDNNRSSDIVLYDVVGGTSSIISKGPASAASNQPNNASRNDQFARFGVDLEPEFAQDADGDLSISDDGDRVAFTSTATNLTADAFTDGDQQCFVYDRSANAVELVSKNATGTAGDGSSAFPTLSGDGTLVSFITLADNMGFARNGQQQLVIKDISASGGTGAVTLVSASVSASGGASTGASFQGFFGGSAGAWKLVFDSTADDMLATTLATTDTGTEVFLYDVTGATLTLVSADSSGNPYKAAADTTAPQTGQNILSSFGGRPSRNGAFVSFLSNAPLVGSDPSPADPSSIEAAFITSCYRYNVTTGSSSLTQVNLDSAGAETNELVDDNSSGHDFGCDSAPAISNNGELVFFWTEQPLEPSDTNKALDLYVKNLDPANNGGITRVVVENGGGQPGALHSRFEEEEAGLLAKPSHVDAPTIVEPGLTPDQYIVCFSSDNGNLVSGDTNGHYDVFTVDFTQAAGAAKADGTWNQYE